MIKFKAKINQIIMANLQELSFSKIHTASEFESLLLKIKLNILETNIDISFKAEIESHISHENIKELALECHQRYLNDIESLKIPRFFKRFYPYLIPMATTGLLGLSWLIIDALGGLKSLDASSALKAAYVIFIILGIRKLFLNHLSANRIVLVKESEILRSKIFGIIYENFNSLYSVGSKHAS